MIYTQIVALGTFRQHELKLFLKFFFTISDHTCTLILLLQGVAIAKLFLIIAAGVKSLFLF